MPALPLIFPSPRVSPRDWPLWLPCLVLPRCCPTGARVAAVHAVPWDSVQDTHVVDIGKDRVYAVGVLEHSLRIG
jgi:hypothetical protein